jgi:phosphomannomutase / phosphoglucomutase
MAIPQHIFRQYDIRGLVENELTPQVAEAVGRAYASAAFEKESGSLQIAVGHDNRPSSPALQAALIKGLIESGVDVIDVGEVPTPLVYWAEKVLGTDGSIQITGSHNPPEWNGIKMTLSCASVYGDDILELRRRISEGDFVQGDGSSRSEEIMARYVEDVVGRFELPHPVKVVADCGNGTGSLVAVELLEALGAEVIPLYCESDGSFPNHHPDPTVDEYVEDLIATVLREGADLGVGFDGDADRIGVVDETGAIVRGDILLLLFGLDLLKRDGPGQKLVFDVKCSQVLPEVFAAAGGEPIMGMTGHSLMKEKMKEVGAPLAGELSGHICFADSYYGFDDALYDACRLIDLVARSPRTLSEMVADFPVMVSTPEIRIEVAEEEKFAVVERALAYFRRNHEVIDVDGARVLFEGGWGLLRASNTQPVIVARFEARSEEELSAIRIEMEDWLRTQGVNIN